MTTLDDLFTNKTQQQLTALSDDAIFVKSTVVENYVNIEQIVKNLGFNIKVSTDARHHGTLKNHTMYLRPNLSSNCKRFTLAHLLGHAVHRHERLTSNAEIFANKYAAQFLVPKKLLLEQMATAIPADQTTFDQDQYNAIIGNIAEAMKVNPLVIDRRLIELQIIIEKTE